MFPHSSTQQLHSIRASRTPSETSEELSLEKRNSRRFLIFYFILAFSQLTQRTRRSFCRSCPLKSSLLRLFSSPSCQILAFSSSFRLCSSPSCARSSSIVFCLMTISFRASSTSFKSSSLALSKCCFCISIICAQRNLGRKSLSFAQRGVSTSISWKVGIAIQIFSRQGNGVFTLQLTSARKQIDTVCSMLKALLHSLAKPDYPRSRSEGKVRSESNLRPLAFNLFCLTAPSFQMAGTSRSVGLREWLLEEDLSKPPWLSSGKGNAVNAPASCFSKIERSIFFLGGASSILLDGTIIILQSSLSDHDQPKGYHRGQGAQTRAPLEGAAGWHITYSHSSRLVKKAIPDCFSYLNENACVLLEVIVIIMIDSIKLSLLILLLPILRASIFAGSISIFQTQYDFTYVTTTSSPLVHFELMLNPTTAAGLLLGRTAPFTVSTNRRDWLHFDYLSSSYCDYSSMVAGQHQYAWTASPGVGQTIYFKIINFEPSRSLSFTATVTEGSAFLQNCPVPANTLPTTYYCAFCDSFHISRLCQHRRYSVLESTTASFSLATGSYTAILLQSQNKIKITCTYSGAISLFLQAQSYSNEMGGIVNYLDHSMQGKHVFATSGKLQLEYTEEGSNIIIGVINHSGGTVNLTIFFEPIQEENVVLIIVIVIGSMLLLIILITLVYIIRRIIRQRHNVIPAESVLMERQRERKQMTSAELDFFFPPVPFGLILQFNGSGEKKEQEQCVICLCPIASVEEVRSGYCKHIFHSGCLTEWFKKQQNCPYCRRDYSRKETMKAYEKISAKDESRAKGQDIVKAIFGVKSQCSLQTLIISDISCDNYQ